MITPLKAPFPYFGGKSRVASEIWARLGDVPNYVEPFFGSGAVLLGRPTEPALETVNDLDGYVANFWRAIQHDPEACAYYADNPVFENDLHARHYWLKQQRSSLAASLEGDPDYYDPKIAGWWAWGMSCWIGGGFCEAKGPWVVVDGQLVDSRETNDDGTWRILPHLRGAGQGTHRKRPQLVGPAGGNSMQGGQSRRRPILSNDSVGCSMDPQGSKRIMPRAGVGAGVINQGIPHGRPNLGGAGGGQGTQAPTYQGRLEGWFAALANRLARVRVCCGDWSRVTGPSVTIYNGQTGVLVDPPYKKTERSDHIYTTDTDCSAAVRAWALENGDNPLYRIALCGYEGEHEMPESWECFAWKSDGGYANRSESRGKENRHRERIWFSPHCLKPAEEYKQATLMEVA
jgi:site-specific DNA-adenine methylase